MRAPSQEDKEKIAVAALDLVHAWKRGEPTEDEVSRAMRALIEAVDEAEKD